jgi:hypothetical protein
MLVASRGEKRRVKMKFVLKDIPVGPTCVINPAVLGAAGGRRALDVRIKIVKMIHFPSLLAGAVLLLASCERRSETVVKTRAEEPIKAEPANATKTFESATLDRAIEAYRANPTEQNKAVVDKAFADLDAEIAELKGKAVASSADEKIEAERKLTDLQVYREKQRVNYAGEKAEVAAESAGEAVKDAAKDVGRAIERTGEAIKESVD